MIRFLSALTLVMVGALSVILFAAGEIYEYQDSFDGAHLPSVDAVVCLAGGRGRLAMAGDLWYRYWERAQQAALAKAPMEIPILYLSGTGHQSNWALLAKQMRRGVVEVLAPKYLMIEDESENTEENAAWFSKNARKNQWKKILLVTSSYHMKRAKLVFERTLAQDGLSVQIETASLFQEPFEPGEWLLSLHGVRVTVNEYLKWLWYRAGH